MEYLRVGHQRHHGIHSLLALRVVAGANVHHYVVQADGYIVHNLAGRLLLVNRHHVRLAINPNDPQYALGVVNLWNQVEDDFARLLDAAGHVVVEVEIAQIHLHLLALQRFARNVAG